jgi:hypothetical protein
MFPRRQSLQGHQLDCPGYSDNPSLSAVTFRVAGIETPRRSQDQERVILRCFSGFYRLFQIRSDRNDAYAGGKCIRSIPRSLLLGSAISSLTSTRSHNALHCFLDYANPSSIFNCPHQSTSFYFKMGKAGFYAELVGFLLILSAH